MQVIREFEVVPPKPEPVYLACDVSLDEVRLYTELDRAMELAFPNRVEPVTEALETLRGKAQAWGTGRCVVVAESTGVYHKLLLRTASNLGLETALANPEAVEKLRVVESNDSGKSDQKDPRVIHLLAKLRKLLEHRSFEEPYNLLRAWNGVYDAAEKAVVAAKNSIHSTLKVLFPDFGFSKDFLYGSRSGAALIKRFGGNPYRIMELDAEEFRAEMKAAAPRIQSRSITRLRRYAASSVKLAVPPREVEVLEFRLRQLWEDYELHSARKAEAGAKMEALYDEVLVDDPQMPRPEAGVVSKLTLARLVAETGPWRDFANFGKIQRFCGMNLRPRTSGKGNRSKRKNKLSKKGRTLARKILEQAILPLVKKKALYGPLYHHKTRYEKMEGAKAMTTMARRFLKMLFGWYRSGKAFDRERVFVCESQYQKQA